MATIPNWYKIAASLAEIDFNTCGLAKVEVSGKIICLAKYNDQVFACTQKCPHAGGILAEGHIDALGNLICPLHKYKFSLKSGRNISGEGYYLKTFDIEENDNGVFVRLDDALH